MSRPTLRSLPGGKNLAAQEQRVALAAEQARRDRLIAAASEAEHQREVAALEALRAEQKAVA